MRLVVLDKASLDRNDLDFTGLSSLEVDIEMFDTSTPEQVADRIAGADIIVTNKVVIDSGLMAQATRLKLVCIAATGTNNVDLNAATDKSVKVCNVTGYATSSVVQHVFMLMTALNTNLKRYQNAVENNCWSNSEIFCLLDFPITELANKTLGIIGYGELGQAVAKVARAFGMNVIIAESFTKNSPVDKQRVTLKQLLKEADVVSLHCPLTTQTENLINHKAFAIMKSSAQLINTARGGIVNEADLLVALKNRSIAGAALDVLAQEPPGKEHLLINSKLDNLIITPHIAWASKEARQRLLDGVVSNIHAFMRGQEQNIINN